MNSKILLVIIALIVVLGTFILLGNKNTNTPPSNNQSESIKSEASATPAAMETNIQIENVILGDLGFVPQNITVKAGTTMVWINKSGKAATVSSDDHPTHKLYPFLNLGEFPSSSSLQVVFDKAGTYSYHNHLNASETGTVTVE